MDYGYGLAANESEEIFSAVSRAVDAGSFRSLWVNYPPPFDGLVKLSTMAALTERAKLGVGVVPLTTRDADNIIEHAKDNPLPTERLLLGVGSGAGRQGALERVRSATELIRSVLHCEVVIAVYGEKMCRLAGEIGDGVLFNWVSPASVTQVSDWVNEGAADADRPCPRRYTYMRFTIGKDGDERLVAETARYAKLQPAHFSRMKAQLDATIVAESGTDLIEQSRAWSAYLDEMILRPLAAEDTVECNLALLDAIPLPSLR